MNRPATLSGPQHQTAMSARIFRVVLDDLTGSNSVANFSHGNNAVWPSHLSDRVWQVQYPFSCGVTHTVADPKTFVCHARSQSSVIETMR